LRYLLEKMPEDEIRGRRADLCASYQQAVVDALAQRTRAALARGEFRSVGLSGGVARNGALRAALAGEAARARAPFFAAAAGQSGDNAAMIAFAAWADPDAQAEGMDLRIDPSLGL
jgi:N6-L-threonylcarbamoyladenine synthase